MIKTAICTRLAVIAITTLCTLGQVQAQERVSEKNDFYQAVNEQTLKKKKIAPTEAGWSWFQEKSLANTKALEKDIKEIAKKEGTYAADSPEQKIADLYTCAMDRKTRNKTARAQLQAMLLPIQRASTPEELTQAICDFKDSYGVGLLVDYNIERHTEKPVYISRVSVNRTVLSKSELEAEREPGLWDAYRDYMADILVESGETKEAAREHSAAMLEMEKSWADAMASSEEINDATVYNRMAPREDVEKLMKNMNGKRLLQAWGLSGEERVFFYEPRYLALIDAAYTQENLPLLKSYLTFQIMDEYAPYSDEALRNRKRAFVMKKYGIKKTRTDEETASRLVQSMLSYELGRIYMKKYGSDQAVADVTQMIGDIRDVYEKRLRENSWLSEQTKAQAIEKLRTLRIFVGAPAADDRPLIEAMPHVISPRQGGTLLGNILHNAKVVYEKSKTFLGTSFNPDKWRGLDPQDVNACYIPDNNSITVPAGILQAPFYRVDGTYGQNLGGIGVIIGHEISHAFDTNGSKYDKDGNMKNWWTKEDYNEFENRASDFEPYYDDYVIDGIRENGALVTSEAIADCGGLSAVTELAKGDEAILRDIYHSFAALFAGKYTPQILRFIIDNDPHPIGVARVNGALSATEGFYRAYDINEGDGMYKKPTDRVHIW